MFDAIKAIDKSKGTSDLTAKSAIDTHYYSENTFIDPHLIAQMISPTKTLCTNEKYTSTDIEKQRNILSNFMDSQYIADKEKILLGMNLGKNPSSMSVAPFFSKLTSLDKNQENSINYTQIESIIDRMISQKLSSSCIVSSSQKLQAENESINFERNLSKRRTVTKTFFTTI